MIKQYHLPLPNRSSMEAEDFLPSPANKEAVEWLLNREPTAWSSHALVLWGPQGAGKTHLMSIWANKRRAVSVAPGDDNITLLLHGHKEPAYLLDNADELIPGHKAAEEWLQHFYNATKSAHIPFLIIARRPPALWHLGLRDIETRLKSCATIEIAQPDDALMRGLLLKLFADRQLMVEGGVVEYLAARLNRMGSAVIEAVAALDEAALETKRKISIPFAQRVLALKQEEE